MNKIELPASTATVKHTIGGSIGATGKKLPLKSNPTAASLNSPKSKKLRTDSVLKLLERGKQVSFFPRWQSWSSIMVLGK